MKRTYARRTRIKIKPHYVKYRLTDEPGAAPDECMPEEMSDEMSWYLLSLDEANFDIAMKVVGERQPDRWNEPNERLATRTTYVGPPSA